MRNHVPVDKAVGGVGGVLLPCPHRRALPFEQLLHDVAFDTPAVGRRLAQEPLGEFELDVPGLVTALVSGIVSMVGKLKGCPRLLARCLHVDQGECAQG